MTELDRNTVQNLFSVAPFFDTLAVKGRKNDLVLLVFKLGSLQPNQTVLLKKFSDFSTHILGSQFFLPQRANSEKGKFFHFLKWMGEGVFSAWGLKTGPLAAL